ncbi:YpsA SLOG family protein [uncultured Desulfosarcina sp.]|uniref:YpsA SLOG family protein n=1 Tax=uncultured Desulfosarcina sp. TaxID=218289 RepID=UPI0029C6441C|nr:putative molybdenum carrier protein [uncultured Desulfosarcina sp.]
MIEKIISGGKPGAAAAAVEVAIKLGLAYGGWCREGEPIPDKYQLERLPHAPNRLVTEKAVEDSHGSLYFTTGETASLRLETTQKAAERLNKPLLILDLSIESGFSASRRIAVWLTENRIRVLHVDGEDEGCIVSSVAESVSKILEATFFLSMMETGITAPLPSVVEHERLHQLENPPETMEAAVIFLERSLSLKDRATIANLTADELVSLHFTLGSYINSHFDLFTTNTSLLTDCQRRSGQWGLAPKDVAAVVIRALWDRLRATCRIRVIK